MIYVVGRRSYLGGVLLRHLSSYGDACLVGLSELAHHSVNDRDVIVNCAFAPEGYHSELASDLGADGTAGRAAQRAGCRYVMLSSRAVYASRLEPPLLENELPKPVSVYGQNKARIEFELQRMLGSRLLVLRCSNVFGGEPPGRRTFVSTALESLIKTGSIVLDMAPHTCKDFVPAEFVGQAATVLIKDGADGIFNVGSGIGLPVGNVATALIKGFGRGDLIVNSTERGEEFRLDVAKLKRATGLSMSVTELLQLLESAASEHKI